MKTVEVNTDLPVFPDASKIDLTNLAPGLMGYEILEGVQVRQQLNDRNVSVVLPSVADGEIKFKNVSDKRLAGINSDIKLAIQSLKDTMTGWAVESQAGFNSYFSVEVAKYPEIGEGSSSPNVKKAVTHTGDWVKWFTEQATDDEIAGTVAWNAARIAAKQKDPVFQQIVKEERQVMVDGLKDGLLQQYAHEEAEEALVNIPQLRVLIGDYTDMKAKQRNGHTVNNSDVIYVRERDAIAELPMLWRKTIRHEGAHALIGKLDGILKKLIDDETLTDHYALAVQDGIWADLSPLAHPLRGSYLGCRHVADAFWGDRDVRLLTQAFSARQTVSRQEALDKVLATLTPHDKQVAGRIKRIASDAEARAVRLKVPNYTAINNACSSMLASRDPSALRHEIVHGSHEKYKKLRKKIAPPVTSYAAAA